MPTDGFQVNTELIHWQWAGCAPQYIRLDTLHPIVKKIHSLHGTFFSTPAVKEKKKKYDPNSWCVTIPFINYHSQVGCLADDLFSLPFGSGRDTSCCSSKLLVLKNVYIV